MRRGKGDENHGKDWENGLSIDLGVGKLFLGCFMTY